MTVLDGVLRPISVQISVQNNMWGIHTVDGNSTRRDTYSKRSYSAKYYAVSVDSTPDVGHADQLTFVVRHVPPDGKPAERFIRLIEIHGHGAENMSAVVTKILEKLWLDISNLRGQSYDNASNMSGIYSGLQVRIRELNPFGHCVLCAAHSLNLVGSAAASSCVGAT